MAYFLSPFALALTIMCFREAMIMVGQRGSTAARDETSSPAGTL
jgi:hypothetical protein